jgi:hypothetical protein
MKFRKIQHGIRVYINLAEEAMIEMLESDKNHKLYKKDITEEQSVIANQLVIKSVFRRRKDDNGLYYTLHDQSKQAG